MDAICSVFATLQATVEVRANLSSAAGDFRIARRQTISDADFIRSLHVQGTGLPGLRQSTYQASCYPRAGPRTAPPTITASGMREAPRSISAIPVKTVSIAALSLSFCVAR